MKKTPCNQNFIHLIYNKHGAVISCYFSRDNAKEYIRKYLSDNPEFYISSELMIKDQTFFGTL